MNRTVPLLALSLLAASLVLVPAASANPFPATYPPCVYGVLHSPCYGGHDVCSGYASLEVPVCVDYPGCHHLSCFAFQQPHAQCTAAVGVITAAAVCTVNGKQYGPEGLCTYCLPLVDVVCTVGTEQQAQCWVPQLTGVLS